MKKLWYILFFTTAVIGQIKPFKIAKLHHTEIALDIKTKQLKIHGVTKFKLSPYFYDLKELAFEAEHMNIKKVLLNNGAINYQYQGGILQLYFSKNYTPKDTLQITIKHTINLRKKDMADDILLSKNLKTCWIIPKNISKTSAQSLFLKVPDQYQTLAGGVLISQKKSATRRTDHWRLTGEQLLRKNFFAVGKFQKKQYQSKGMVYNFYGDAALAKQTIKAKKESQMMAFFKKITGLAYPYKSYKELIVKKNPYAENYNGLVLIPFTDNAFEDVYGRIDRDFQKAVQIVQHWTYQIFFKNQQQEFLNKDLAYYLAYLWLKKNYTHKDIQVYTANALEIYFSDPSELRWVKAVFVFEMLKTQLGNKAFAKGLKSYFRAYQNKLIEPATFRQMLEHISGRDLTFFFAQWFQKGYPTVEVHTDYNTIEKTVTITFEQKNTNEKQENFAYYLPVKVRFYYKNYKDTRVFYLNALQNSFTMVYKEIPKWISINADKELLGNFKIAQDTSEWLYQYLHSPYYQDKKQALEVLLEKQEYKNVLPVLEKALNDPFTRNKILVLESLQLVDKFAKRKIIEKIENLAYNADNPFLQAAAIKALGKLVSNRYYEIFKLNFEKQHPKIKAAALESLYYLNSKKALELAKGLSAQVKHSIGYPLSKLYIQQKKETQMAFIAAYILQGMYLIKDKKSNAMFKDAMFWIAESNNIKALKNLVNDMVQKGNQYRKYNFHLEMVALIRELIFTQEKLANDRTPFIKVLEKGLEQLTSRK